MANEEQNNLYVKLLPVFNTKIKEWEREKYYNVKSIDIWNYCVTKLWARQKNLRMYELVDNILNIDLIDFIKYIKDARND